MNLYLRWEQGQLGWHDPASGQHIATFESERVRADTEQAARIRAEERISQLEEQLRRTEKK